MCDIDSDARLEDSGGKARERETWRPSRVSGRESGERVERRERREREITESGKPLGDRVDSSVASHLNMTTDPVDLDGGLLEKETVELTSV